jgi:multidrug transporter EmrE-like cation transporter
MSKTGIFLILLTVLLLTAGNLMLRVGIARAGGVHLSFNTLLTDALNLLQQPFFIGGFLSAVLGVLVWFRVLSTENLNTSYPLLVSLTLVLVSLGATFLLQEPMSSQKALGIGVIIVGMVLLITA